MKVGRYQVGFPDGYGSEHAIWEAKGCLIVDISSADSPEPRSLTLWDPVRLAQVVDAALLDPDQLMFTSANVVVLATLRKEAVVEALEKLAIGDFGGVFCWSADAVVEDLVDACLEFTLVLLEKRMPDDRQFLRVKAALVRCGDAWEGLDSIPRLAVNALVDLQPTVLGAAETVVGGERKLLLEWSYEIGDLVRAAVGVKGWPA